VVAGLLLFTDRTDGSGAQETNVAKMQRRSNREIRKPKSKKVPVAELAPVSSFKGMMAPLPGFKKKS